MDSRRNKKAVPGDSAPGARNAEEGRPGASTSLSGNSNNNNNILTIPYVPGKASEERGLGCLVLERIADVVGRNDPFGDQGDGELDLDDSRVQLLDYDFARQKNPTDNDKQLLDKTQEIEANLLLPRECDVSKVKRKIKSKGKFNLLLCAVQLSGREKKNGRSLIEKS